MKAGGIKISKALGLNFLERHLDGPHDKLVSKIDNEYQIAKYTNKVARLRDKFFAQLWTYFNKRKGMILKPRLTWAKAFNIEINWKWVSRKSFKSCNDDQQVKLMEQLC